jgi:two-component system cell cycle sensor histidine kinase/response regulator CckA
MVTFGDLKRPASRVMRRALQITTGHGSRGRLVAGSGVPIDLMLTDVIMPRMNRAELADRISELRPGLKMLFMSGYLDRTVSLHDHLKEGAEFIQKPFTPNSLARKLRQLLGEAEAEQGQG